MIAKIALFLIFGKPLVVYLGIITLLSFSFTALVGFLNFKGNHAISFPWHPRLAALSLLLALLHGFVALAIYFNF